MFSKFASNNNGDGTEILMIYGKQDRHVDGDGRQRTYKLMTDAGVHFEWLEVRVVKYCILWVDCICSNYLSFAHLPDSV